MLILHNIYYSSTVLYQTRVHGRIRILLLFQFPQWSSSSCSPSIHTISLYFKVEIVGCSKNRNETHQSRAIVLYSLLSSRFNCANFRSGVPGIPVSVSRLNCSQCAGDPTFCARCIVLNDVVYYYIRDTRMRVSYYLVCWFSFSVRPNIEIGNENVKKK